MNRQATQFWISIIGITSLAVIAGIAAVGTLFYDAPTELAFMLVGGLLSLASAASSYLFRINGKGQTD